jgi:hypothetical protein
VVTPKVIAIRQASPNAGGNSLRPGGRNRRYGVYVISDTTALRR